MTRTNHAHIYSDQRENSVFVFWTKQVYLQTRLKRWQWWGTPGIIWNRIPERRSKIKRAITKCRLTLCRSIEKRHFVWAGVSAAGVWWLFWQYVSDIWWCISAVAVVAQTSFFYSTSSLGILTLIGSQWSDFKCMVILRDFGRRKIIRAA